MKVTFIKGRKMLMLSEFVCKYIPLDVKIVSKNNLNDDVKSVSAHAAIDFGDPEFELNINKYALLTKREKTVIKLIYMGLSNAEIASEIGVADATARAHVAHLMKKLGAKNRWMAVRKVFNGG